MSVKLFAYFPFAAATIACGCLLTASARGDELKDMVEVYKSRAEVVSAMAQNKQANASIINALANHLKARGETAKLNQETRKLSAENDLLETKVFYDKKAAYYAHRETHKPQQSTPEQYAERARQSAPMRLSSYQLWTKPGYVRWPSLLQSADFAVIRNNVDYLVLQRTAAESGAGSQNCVDLQSRIDEFCAALKQNIRRYKPVDYLAAKKFLDSLAYEAQFPAEDVVERTAAR